MAVESNLDTARSPTPPPGSELQELAPDAQSKRIRALELESARRLDKLSEAGAIIATLQQRLSTEQEQTAAALKREDQARAALEEAEGKLAAVQAVSTARHEKLLEAEQIVAAQRDRIATLQRIIAELEASRSELEKPGAETLGADSEWGRQASLDSEKELQLARQSQKAAEDVTAALRADVVKLRDQVHQMRSAGDEDSSGDVSDNQRRLERRYAVVRGRLLILRERMAHKVIEADAVKARLSIAETTATELRNQLDQVRTDLTESRLQAAESAADAVSAREHLSILRSEHDRVLAQLLETRLQAEKNSAEAIQAREALAAIEDRLKEAHRALDAANTRRMDEAEKSEAELIALRHRIATTESALAQRRLEVEETSQELEQAHTNLRQLEADYNDAMERLAAASKAEDEVKLLSEKLEDRFEEALISQRLLRDAEDALETISQEADARFAASLKTEADLKRKLKEASNALATAQAKLQSKEEELRRITSERDASDAEKVQLTDTQTRLRAEINENLRHIRRLAAEELGRVLRMLLDLPRRPFESAKGHLERKIALLRRCGVFDADWYLSANPDIAEAGVDALRHYVEFGAQEGREPNSILATEIQRVAP